MPALVVGAEGHAAHLEYLAEGLRQALGEAGRVERLREERRLHEPQFGFFGELGAIASLGLGGSREGLGVEGLKLVPRLLKLPSAFNLFSLFRLHYYLYARPSMQIFNGLQIK